MLVSQGTINKHCNPLQTKILKRDFRIIFGREKHSNCQMLSLTHIQVPWLRRIWQLKLITFIKMESLPQFTIKYNIRPHYNHCIYFFLLGSIFHPTISLKVFLYAKLSQINKESNQDKQESYWLHSGQAWKQEWCLRIIGLRSNSGELNRGNIMGSCSGSQSCHTNLAP